MIKEIKIGIAVYSFNSNPFLFFFIPQEMVADSEMLIC